MITTQDCFPTILLIHGAWHGAWCWQNLSPLLEQNNITVLQPNLLGRSNAGIYPQLKDQVDFFVDLIKKQNNPIFLVGHSYGGIIASQVAEHVAEKVVGIAYISAFLLQNKQSLFDVVIDNPSQVSQSLIFSEHLLDINREVARECFYNHCDTQLAQRASDQLCPEPIAAMQSPINITDNRFGKINKYYFLCGDDKASLPSFQRKMCDQFSNVNVIQFDSDHSPFLSHPKKLSKMLIACMRQQTSFVEC